VRKDEGGRERQGKRQGTKKRGRDGAPQEETAKKFAAQSTAEREQDVQATKGCEISR
jgi:hypothetical protein